MTASAVSQDFTFPGPEELAHHVADRIVERALAHSGRFAICLCGGSTPKRIYELLATAPRLARFPWDRTHWFWGDERLVAHDDPQSNFRMAWQAFLGRAPVPPENVHAIPTEAQSAEVCATRYESTLKRFYGADALDGTRPIFDLTLLGLGEDGHIASLFPGSPALAETRRWAVPVVGANPINRITLTYPALEASRATAFLVVGEQKRAVLARVRSGDPKLPATRLHPAGTLCWFADRSASPRSQTPPLAGNGKVAAHAGN